MLMGASDGSYSFKVTSSGAVYATSYSISPPNDNSSYGTLKYSSSSNNTN
jgi:hypothetical protein